MLAVDRRASLGWASVLAWGVHAFYAVACAWPEAGGWWVLPFGVHLAACLLYGLWASWRGWPVLAGCASGVLAAPLLRAAAVDHGAAVAVVGFAVAAATMAGAMLASFSSEVDDAGRVDAREVTTALWLAGCVAAGLGLLLADTIGWVLRG